MKLINRPICVFCSSCDHRTTQIRHYAKVGFKPWGGKVLECNDCGSQWTTPVPDCNTLEKMYRTKYSVQANGLKRWRTDYPDTEFDESTVILEIGPGKQGMKDDCQGAYHTWELNSSADFDGLFDFATDEQLEHAFSLGITHIVALDVYEHVIDPRQFIVNCHRILKPGGLLYLKQGELKGKDEHSRREGKRQAAHINCPSGEGMSIVLEGFEIEKGEAGTCHEDRDACWILKRF